LFSQYETELLTAATDAGLPVLNKMDSTQAASIMTNASLKKTKYRLVAQHLKDAFGGRLFIPASGKIDRFEPY